MSSTMTQCYEDYIYFRCQGVELRYVSVQEDINWGTVRTIFEEKAKKEVASRDLFSRATQIEINEIALRKGHKDYVAQTH